MNKKEFVRTVSEVLRDNDVKKPVTSPKQVFHISDDEGNSKDFTIKKVDKKVIFTQNDVEAVLDACIEVIEEAMKQGERINIHGFGSFGLNYRKPRTTKCVGTNEEISVEGRYVPKYWPGKDMKVCAKVYGLNLQNYLDGIEDNDGAVNEDGTGNEQ